MMKHRLKLTLEIKFTIYFCMNTQQACYMSYEVQLNKQLHCILVLQTQLAFIPKTWGKANETTSYFVHTVNVINILWIHILP